jgi:hypothetical protein
MRKSSVATNDDVRLILIESTFNLFIWRLNVPVVYVSV